MKSAQISYHSEFPQTPLSGWVGVRMLAWARERTASGQLTRPRSFPHPFLAQRKLWCQATVSFDTAKLRFALPQELDHFLDVMLQNPLPSGASLVAGHAVGRPNRHWLSRLPKRLMPWKTRQRLCRYLTTAPELRDLREFYRDQPVRFSFPGYFNSYMEAYNATDAHEEQTIH